VDPAARRPRGRQPAGRRRRLPGRLQPRAEHRHHAAEDRDRLHGPVPADGRDLQHRGQRRREDREAPRGRRRRQKEWGAWVYYNAATCKNAVGTLLGYGFKVGGVVLPIGANVAVALDPEPLSKGGLYVGTNLVVLPTGAVMVWAGGQMVEGADKSQKDPPDRRYKVYAGVRHTPRVRVRSGNGISRAGASALGAYLTAQLRAGALGKAVGATVDKAGGAQKARNRTWQGRQIRRAVRYARALVSAASALPKLRAAAARALRSSPQFSQALSRRAVLRSQARIRRSGFTRGAVALLRRLGLESAEIRSLRRRGGHVKLGGDLRPIAMLSDPRIDDGYRATAAYFRLWASSPQIIAASKLR